VRLSCAVSVDAQVVGDRTEIYEAIAKRRRQRVQVRAGLAGPH